MAKENLSAGARSERKEAKIPVSQLKIGMFVSSLDRDWLETPFLIQGVNIRTQAEIDTLSEYCDYVYILVNKPIDLSAGLNLDYGKLIGRKPEKYETSDDFSGELSAANDLRVRQGDLANGMIDGVRDGKAIPVKEAHQLVEDCVASVVKHPDALAFMTRLKGIHEYTVEHCMNVCTLAVIFGRKLGLKRRQLINLGLCGFLHDVGKARTPMDILDKPGRLTPEEYEIMKLHVVHGKDILSEAKGVLQEAIDVAYGHHERIDGRGYPEGKHAHDVSLFTKIITIVDAYDAITGDRVYAKGKPSSEALRILYENKGIQFDEDLVMAFIQTIGIYPPGAVAELANGSIALVLDSENKPKHLPNILVVLGPDKQPCEERFIELDKTIDGEVSPEYLIRTCLVDGCYDIKLSDYLNKGVFDRLKVD